MIDLSNNFYIVKLNKREEYERALLDGPLMIGDNYLHVQKWRPLFRADKEEIYTMSVWVRFPVLPVECYSARWLKQAGNHIGRTVKVDFATLLASRGQFARVCVEVDLDKPLMAGYVMRWDYYRLQYEGLHDLCFGCGRYGHRDPNCPEKFDKHTTMGGDGSSTVAKPFGVKQGAPESIGYGEWTTVQRGRRRAPSKGRGSAGISSKGRNGIAAANNQAVDSGAIHAGSNQGSAMKDHARVSPNGVTSPSTAGKAQVTRGSDLASGSTSSRFASLDIKTVGEDMDVEAAVAEDYVDAEEDSFAPNGAMESEAAEIAVRNRVEEEVVIASSHAKLVEGLQAVAGPGQNVGRSSVSMGQRKMKEKVLRDVTNKLDPKPVKLKPSWVGGKAANGSGLREVGVANKWVCH